VVHVIGDDTLSVREQPSLDAPILGRLTDETQVYVLEGPQTAEGYIWWKVSAPGGVVGWSVEGADEVQTLIPVQE
jgi:hypothetical protein